MTGLLISVRSAAEAEIALAGGADLIDVKEPSRGALGAADPATWRAIQKTIASRAPTSAALGELVDERIEALARQASGFRFAKIGLAACAGRRDWRLRWERVALQLPPGVAAVPVAYADGNTAEAPAPEAVLRLAAESTGRLMLIDTFCKQRGALLDHWPLAELQAFVELANRQGVQLVLAGSLNESSIGLLLPLRPAWIGVRGAVCGGPRESEIETERVKSLVQWMHARMAMHAVLDA